MQVKNKQKKLISRTLTCKIKTFSVPCFLESTGERSGEMLDQFRSFVVKTKLSLEVLVAGGGITSGRSVCSYTVAPRHWGGGGDEKGIVTPHRRVGFTP